MARDLLEPEFGTYSSWLVDAISRLDPADRIPAACRGTGRPALLAELAGLLELTEGSCLLDIGSGLGGPAAWVTQKYRSRVICLDLMEVEIAGSMRLFPGLSGVVGSAAELPLPDESVDAAWALGVVEMVPERERSINEVERVVKPGGRFAIYGFFATGDEIPYHPAANLFDRPETILQMFERAGLQVIRATSAAADPAPAHWGSYVESVRAAVRREHAGERTLSVAETQLGSFNWLRLTGQITDWVIVGEKAMR